MGKYAVIIGVNYVKDPRAALRGCCNDARIMRETIRQKGFKEENIKLLVDDDDEYESPDHVNVKNALNWLCSDREEGDIIFLHFSGHGTQVPDDGDDNDVETDNLDEAIVLERIFLMSDDDLKQYFSKLPPGSRATVVMDCCHSGSMLDGENVVIEGSKDEDGSEEQLGESEELLAVLGAGNREYGETVSENRSLPIDTISEMMSERLGMDVPPTGSGVNGAMAQLFGGSAGKLMMKFAMSQMKKQGIPEDSPIFAIASTVLGQFMNGSGSGKSGGGGGGGGGSDLISGLLGGGSGGGGNPLGAIMGAIFGGGGGGGRKKVKDESDEEEEEEEDDESSPQRPPQQQSDLVASYMANLGLAGQESSTAGAPPYDPMHGAVPKEVCVLITGCQANETSADVRLGNGDAFGALTKTLTDIQRNDPDVSYYNLVTKVRGALAKGGYSQNPCLETSGELAHESFVCSGDE